MPKTVLVLEAGGMRNAFLSGVLTRLADLGIHLADHVHSAYACSSAAATAAYLVSGQIHETRSVWFRLTGGQAFGLASLYRTGRIGDVDFVIDEVCADLDVNAIARARAKLIVNVVSAQDGVVYLPAGDNMKRILKATSAIPFICRPVVLDGMGPCLDGGIADPLPFVRATADGADRVIVISNRPKGFQVARLEQLIPSYTLRPWQPVRRANEAMPGLYARTWQEIEAAVKDGWCYVIRPESHLPANRFSRDQNRIAATIAVGMKVAGDHAAELKRFLAF